MNTLILGATGLCGNFMVKYALRANEIKNVFTITRSPLPDNQGEEPKITSFQEKDNEKWEKIIRSEIPDDLDILFTGLATIRTIAGQDYQYTIDHDLNIELAKVAKEKGCKTLVVVSSLGANENSHFFYPRMKGEIERDLIALDFDRTIILRPGILLGDRLKKQKGMGNGTAVKMGNWFYRSRWQWLLAYPVKGEEVAKVGVHLALNSSKDKVQIVNSDKILDITSKL